MNNHTLMSCDTLRPLGCADGTAGAWVPAEPSRFWLWYVIGVTGMPWPALAARAGVSVTLVQHLLFGRLGRPVQRISPTDARRIRALDVTALAALGEARLGEAGLREDAMSADSSVPA